MDDVPVGSPAMIEVGEGRCDYLTAQSLVRQSRLQYVLWYFAYRWWLAKEWAYELIARRLGR